MVNVTNPQVDNSTSHTVVRVYDLEAEPGVEHEVIHFYGDCVTSPKQCAEEWLQANDFIPINVSGSAWEERGIGNKQATLEEVGK
jgi:hypothetical protein